MKWNQVKHGDNLDIMQELPSESIDLIYCDILYGTGRDFGDYKDLPAKRDVIDAFYRPRLQEMYRLLKETGSIYLQMDSTIDHWIRCLLERFFVSHFLNQLIWKRISFKRKTTKKFPQKHDVILVYTKTDRYVFNTQYKAHKPEYLKRFKMDEHGRLFYITNKTNGEKRKIYLDWVDGDIIDSIWEDIPPVNSQAIERTGYPTQKPESLLERIIKASSNEGDVVVDFFCGSGTTLAVAKRLNRQYFGCDISGKAIEITRQRLKRTEPERQQELFVNDVAGMDNNAHEAEQNPPRQVSWLN